MDSQKKTFTFKKKSNINKHKSLQNCNCNELDTISNKRMKFKKKTKTQYTLFIDLCKQHGFKYFQFYDTNEWTGPAIKVSEQEFDSVYDIFETSNINTIILNGLGFVIIRPTQKISDENIVYPSEHYSSLGFTHNPIIPYNSENEDIDSDSSNNFNRDCNEDDDTHSDISIEESFIAEEWKYDGTVYLLDTKTNYLYFPSTLEFIGEKTSEFSIDFDAKEH